MALAEQLTLAFLCAGCIVHWVRHAVKAPAAAISAVIASGSGGGSSGGGSASTATAGPALCWMHLELCAFAAATAIILALTCSRWWGRARPWAAAGVRLAAFVAIPPGLTWVPLLAEAPGGALVDGVRVFVGV